MSLEAQVSRVAVRMPEFVATEPDLWFAMVEGSFRIAGGQICNGGEGHHYKSTYRRGLPQIKDGADTTSACHTRGEDLTPPGARRRYSKPLQFLRHLQGLADPAVPESLMKSLWMNRLSRNVQVSLAIVKDSSLQDLAVHADHIMEAFRPPVQMVNETTGIEAIISAKLAQLTLGLNQEIVTLRTELAGHEDRSRRDRSRGRSQHCPRSNSLGRQPIDSKCWYHWKFGARSTRCRQPCNYTSENERGLH
ncbi:uncharacterized protein LOC123678633 [Harmonia axyridis]|uniref:uncharacterized protein LOC123678633 n=1 Tax=Harmonia axyridis TaxID=115357 RepID=UPI001E279102|nr:uncharacterized protein LOC123678633 [Harmonia axyridis]